jgi:C-terminal processing protease CtpA/Prc
MGKLNPTVFADDSSFEEQFVEEEEEEEEEEEVERFTVNVPAGKLGMVIDTPEGSLPIVHAIKEWSILENTVKMGDKLIFVDDEDVTEMTAVEISKLISLRSDRPRSLVFHRVLPRSDFIDMY